MKLFDLPRAQTRTRPAFLVLLVLLGAGRVAAAEEERRASFLSEKLRIPESELFQEDDYIESGVGLTFGVDRKLSYYAGDYAQAARQFTRSVQRYRYKSEIWVYLARAYFYTKEPERAREVLIQAAATMPDLELRLWRPLMAGLDLEIRRRANQLQLQVDFYSRGQDDYLSLFRLYRFLEDYPGASGVIHSAEARARDMERRAQMSSGNSRKSYRGEVRKWQTLGTSLREELRLLGVAVVGDAAPGRRPAGAAPGSADAELLEATQLLQLRVDFYHFLVAARDYQTLFDNYIELKQPQKAAEVIKSVEGAIRRREGATSSAEDLEEEADLRRQVEELEEMKQGLQAALDNVRRAANEAKVD